MNDCKTRAIAALERVKTGEHIEWCIKRDCIEAIRALPEEPEIDNDPVWRMKHPIEAAAQGEPRCGGATEGGKPMGISKLVSYTQKNTLIESKSDMEILFEKVAALEAKQAETESVVRDLVLAHGDDRHAGYAAQRLEESAKEIAKREK